jgi:hypothetical protein
MYARTHSSDNAAVRDSVQPAASHCLHKFLYQQWSLSIKEQAFLEAGESTQLTKVNSRHQACITTLLQPAVRRSACTSSPAPQQDRSHSMHQYASFKHNCTMITASDTGQLWHPVSHPWVLARLPSS